MNDLLSEGAGNSFSYSFGSGTPEGWGFVRFYDDKDGSLSAGYYEAYTDSPDIWIQQNKVYALNVEVSSKLPAGAAAAVAARLDGASNLLRKKDSATDYRSAVIFTAASVQVFTATPAGGARPDPVVNQKTEQDKHFDAPSDMVIVQQLDGVTLGLTDDSDWHQIIIQWDASNALLHETIAHEMGHGVGLNHDGHAPPMIMDPVANTSYNELTQADAEAYD